MLTSDDSVSTGSRGLKMPSGVTITGIASANARIEELAISCPATARPRSRTTRATGATSTGAIQTSPPGPRTPITAATTVPKTANERDGQRASWAATASAGASATSAAVTTSLLPPHR